MKYKVGDKVRIKDNLSPDNDYKIAVVNSMCIYKDCIATVVECVVNDKYSPYYLLDIDNSKSMWTDDMFEETLYEIGDKVLVRSDFVKDKVDYYQYGSHHKNTVVPEMMNLKGQVVTIIANGSYGYGIKEDDGEWTWTDEMFSGLAP